VIAVSLALGAACEAGARPPDVDTVPAFTGADADRPHIAVRLDNVTDGLPNPTDVQFPPGRSDVAIVLSQGGFAQWVSIADGARGDGSTWRCWQRASKAC
jgi:hypothetical protein